MTSFPSPMKADTSPSVADSEGLQAEPLVRDSCNSRRGWLTSPALDPIQEQLIQDWKIPVVKDRARGYPSPDEPGVFLVPVGRDRLAKIDAEDYPLVMPYRWYGSRYAEAKCSHGGRQHTMSMHRLVMLLGMGGDSHVDHRNHDGFDNRKDNLRHCGPHENLWNQRRPRNNKSGHKNVHYSKSDGAWRASVKARGRSVTKTCRTMEEAVAWAQILRERLHGEFACHE